MEEKCVFCKRNFDVELNNQEHVLLNCLGGRFKTAQVDCSVCNNKFGIEIDEEMAISVQEFRCVGALRSGDGKLPPPIKNITLKNGKKIDLLAGMVPFDRSVKYERQNLADGKLQVQFGAGSYEQLSKLLPNFAKGSGISVEQLILLIQQIDIGIQQEAISEHLPFNFAFGGLGPTRSMAKSLIVLWCHFFGNDEFIDGRFEEIKKFVIDDSFSKLNGQFVRLDSRRIPFDEEVLSKKEFGNHYNVLSVVSDSNGNLSGVFRMYNFVSWIFNFKGKSKNTNSNISLISNPLNPSQWGIYRNINLKLDSVWFETSEYNLTNVNKDVASFMDTITELNQQRSMATMVEESMRDYFPADGGVIESDHIAFLSRDLAEEYVTRMYGLDRTKNVSGDRVGEILKSLVEKSKK